MSRARIFAIVSLAVVVVAGGVLWWVFFRDTSPEAPTLEGAVAGVETTLGGDDASPTSPASIEGGWALAGDGDSYVGYRVQEQLAGIGAKTAVGRTPLVEGTMTIDDGAVTSVAVDADLRGLESDDSRRDGAIRRQALETDTFPDAGFRSTAPIPLPDGAADGEAFTVTASGELTLHGVTRDVEVPLEARLVDDRVVVVGSLPILFADYGIEKPSALIVLSVEDDGVMEFQLFFERSG